MYYSSTYYVRETFHVKTLKCFIFKKNVSRWGVLSSGLNDDKTNTIFLVLTFDLNVREKTLHDVVQ